MKLNSIKEVRVIFENCESIIIPVQDVTYLYVGNLFEDLRINNGLKKADCLLERYVKAKTFHIKFMYRKEYIRALIHNDVTNIYLYDENGNEEYFSVLWSNDEYNNEYQTTKFNNTIITIDVRKGNENKEN